MEPVNLLIPETTGGRLVMGNPLKGFTSDPQGRPYTDRKTGQPVTRYMFNVAVPKTDPCAQKIIQTLYQVAQAGFPNYFVNGQCQHRDFAFKYVDGDSQEFDQGGTRWCDKTGYPGNYVFKFSSGFAPKVYTKGGGAAIIDPTAIKTGDYIRVYVSIVPNGDNAKPGLFINPQCVEFIGYGDEISNGPNAAAIFGGAPVTGLPTGATAAPTAGTPIQPPVGRTVTPAPDFLQPPAPTPPPVVPVENRYMYNGQTYTETQLLTAKWTPAQIATLTRM